MMTVRTPPVIALGCDDMCVRILLIEDDRRLAELLVKRLRAEGHEAETSGDGIEGLAFAESGGYELVIVDVMLPGMDGVALTTRLREGGSDIPVLMLTARDTVDDRVTGSPVSMRGRTTTWSNRSRSPSSWLVSTRSPVVRDLQRRVARSPSPPSPSIRERAA